MSSRIVSDYGVTMVQILDHRGEPFSGQQPASEVARWGAPPPATEDSWWDQAGAETDQWGVRRWEAAQTTRLTNPDWRGATDRSVNLDIAEEMGQLVKRSHWEIENNGIVKGMVRTHRVDLIGDNGPQLQVISNGPGAKRYSNSLEQIFQDWWEVPDVNGVLGGADILVQWVNMLWKRGEFVCQMLDDKSLPETSIRFRLHNIHPRRLATPAGLQGSNDVILGVQRNATGKPIAYHFGGEQDSYTAISVGATEEVPAQEILHGFDQEEPGQARGVPWLASVLKTVNDLRNYDDEVLEAARQATYWSVVLSAEHPSLQPLKVNGCMSMQRRVMATAPPGWKPTALSPPQPSTNYHDYRAERHIDLGRPIGMPGIMVRLDARDTNYSSARFIKQIYQRNISAIQAWLGRIALRRIVDRLRREATMLGMLPERVPTRVRYKWIWPRLPNIDPAKSAMAEAIRLRSRTLSLHGALAEWNTDFEVHVEQLTREAEAFKAAGIEQMPLAGGKGGSAQRRLAVDVVADMFQRSLATTFAENGGNGRRGP